MAIKDISSDLVVMLNTAFTVSADGKSVGTSIDTADYDLGVMFTFAVVSYTDGTHVLGADESDDNSTWAAVPAEKIIGAGSFSAASASGDILPKIGVFSNKRYVRPTLTSSGVTTGAVATSVAILGAELMPAA